MKLSLPAKLVGYKINNKIIVYLALYCVLLAIFSSIIFWEPNESSSFPILRIVIISFASILLTKYFVYMFLSPWHEIFDLKKQQKAEKKYHGQNYNPRVSILVPAWNEQDGVITTVEALLKSTYRNIEIIVIDNASTDSTAKNTKALINRYNAVTLALFGKSVNDVMKKYNAETSALFNEVNIPVVRYLYEGKKGKGHALNHGLKKANGEIIMSIDADCFVPPDTIANFVKYFRDPSVMAAVGNVRIGNIDTVVGVVQYLEFLFSFYFKKAESLINTIYIIGGAAGAFRREVFDKIGPYSATNITEDIELSMRIQAAGMRIVYAHDAFVFTEGAVTLQGLMKQRLRWKRGRFETLIEHKYMFFSTQKEHNKLLTWILLPLTLFGEVQLALEMIFLAFLYVFSFFTNDFSSFFSGIIVVSSMFLVQVIFDNHRQKTISFLLLAPIGWLLFYVSTFVETSALFRALIGYIRNTEVTWQKWDRQGVFSK